MKKYLCFMFLLFVSFMGIVKADNGPSVEYGSLSFMEEPGGNFFDIYELGSVDNNALNGVNYESTTNTLTIKDLKGSYLLLVDNMGEDFKLNAEGTNDFLAIYVSGEEYKTNITITGDGKLILNKEKNVDYEKPILSINKSKIIFEDSVSLELYAVKDENDPDFPTFVIGCDGMSENDETCIVFNGSDSPEIKRIEKVANHGTKSFWGFAILPEEIESFKIATKDDKKYAYTVDNDGKVTLYLNVLKEDTYSHKWYIGNTEDDESNKTIYNNTSEAESDTYVLTEDKAYRGYYRYLYLLQQDANGKEYGLIYGSDYSDVAPYGIPFDITDDTVTIGDKTYKYLTFSNIDPRTLGPVIDWQGTGEYVHYVEGETLILDRLKKEEVTNPKTNDNIYTYVSLLSLSLFILIKSTINIKKISR